MKRDISTLSKGHFDHVIVGGGIHGAVIAYELAAAGYKVAIIDKNDFTSATSANSFKIIHGGIRYLQSFDILRMRESIYSRRYFLKRAPHLVKSFPCIMPVSKDSYLKPFMYQVALGLNDLISWDRNKGVGNDQTIPRSQFIQPAKVAEMLPGIDISNISGAIHWHDAVALESERLVLYFIQKAVSHGAVAANYVNAKKVNTTSGHVCGITTQCRFTKKYFDIKTRMVINCTGPWLNEIVDSELPGRKQKRDYAVALNLIVDRLLFESYAVGIEGEGGYQKEGSLLKKEKRLFFFVPWHQKTMIGTYYREYHGNVNHFTIQKADITAFIRDINTVYPAANISPEKVCFYHAGLIPIRSIKGQTSTNFTLQKNTKIIDHKDQGAPKGIISIDSTKYTTAAATARKLKKYLEKNKANNISTEQNGSRTVQQNKLEKTKRQFINHWPVTPEDIRQFIDHEMVYTLGDIIFRRTNLGALEKLTDARLRFLSKAMGKELGWNETKINQEVNSVKNYFRSLDV